MNNELEVSLRGLDWDYPIKANCVLRSRPYLFCPDCRCGRKTDFMGRTDVSLCVPSCEYAMMVWIFNSLQWKIWSAGRPPELKQMDIEKAVKEGRITVETIKAEEGLTITETIKIEETLVKIITTRERKVIRIEKGVLRESEEAIALPLFFRASPIRCLVSNGGRIKYMINSEDFKKIDLRVVKIIKAEKLEGSEKLIKLQIDGGDEKRQIIAGIAQFHKPQDLIGKEIIVIWNLEPRVLFGNESQGMLLAAEHNGEPVILIPQKEVPPGTKIR